jgi:cation diffusion facilitator family transporter
MASDSATSVPAAPGGHEHTFGLDRPFPGERRTRIVLVLTAVTMVVEIAAGWMFGSMALLADGLHMGSHATALGISLFAYVYARGHARDPRFSFGTGKVNSLGGFAGAVLLAAFAVVMAWESVARFIHPTTIQFNQAILVAVVGLLVNAGSAFVLGNGAAGPAHKHDHDLEHGHSHRHDDHNLRSAYLHVLADALTSVLAIVALLAGKYAGLSWMDTSMGLVGAVLVTSWSIGLIRMTSRVLLDHQAPEGVRAAVLSAITQRDQCRVTDLHVWAVGPGRYAVAVALETDQPLTPEEFKARLPKGLGLAHVTIELSRRSGLPVATDSV